MSFPRIWWLAFFCLLFLRSPAASFGQQEQFSIYAEKLRALEQFLESEFKTACDLLKENAGSRAEVDEWESELTLVRHDLGIVEADLAKVQSQCRRLIEIRTRELGRAVALVRSGFGSERRLCTRMRRLAFARYLLRRAEKESGEDLLVEIVELCQKEVALFEQLLHDGAASAMELQSARYRATLASHHLATKRGTPESCLEQLREAVAVGRSECDEIGKLRRNGYADVTDEYFANAHRLNLCLLVTSIERNHEESLRYLDDLIRLHRQTLPKLGATRKGNVARLLIECNVVQDVHRKLTYEREGRLPNDMTLAEIGS
ncbi:MAG: hypothetical protein AAGJ83_06765 [Planctomycetota bacterium]